MMIRTSSIANFALLFHRASNRRGTARVMRAPNAILTWMTRLPMRFSGILEVIANIVRLKVIDWMKHRV